MSGVVVDEVGAVIAGADIVYSWWADRENKAIVTKSDEQGRFTLPVPDGTEGGAWPTGALWVAAPGRRLLYQTLFEEGVPPPTGDLRLVAPPPADLPIKVVGPDGKPVAGAQVSLPMVAYKKTGGLLLPKALSGLVATDTDRDGMVKVIVLAREQISEIRVTTLEYGIQSRYLDSSADAVETITIRLRAAGRVRGRLIASDGGLDDGTKVSLLSYPLNAVEAGETMLGHGFAVTDQQGRFDVPAIAAGVIRHVSVEQKNERHYVPVPPDNVALGGGQTIEVEIPLKPTVHVRGTVRRAGAGEPVAGAVLGVFRERGDASGAARTDAEGRFDFWLLPGPQSLHLSSINEQEAPGWFRQRQFQLAGGQSEFELPPIEITLARGRIVDPAGRGLARTKIEKVVTKLDFQGQWVENPVVGHTGSRDIFSDSNGEYRAWVEAGAPYRVQVSLEGRAPQWTEWTDMVGASPRFPDIVVAPLRSVAGRVVDRQGRPVPGARVFQAGDGPRRTAAASDDDGRFRLDGFQNESGFLFPEKDGFRFHGQAVQIGDDEVRFVLTRTDEPPQRRLATLSASDPADDLALAMRVLKPALDRLPEEKDERNRWSVLDELAEVDPAAALDRLEMPGFDGERAQGLRITIAKRWADDHPDDAMAIIESLDSAYMRAAGYAMSAEAMPASLRQRKIEWLAKARFHLRGLDDPTMRVALSAVIARSLWQNGDAHGAGKIVAEIRPEAEKMPLDSFAAYVRGATAEALAPLDLPAALAMIKDLKEDREYDRHHGNIARLIATAKPAEALRVLQLVRDEFQREQYAVHVACQMAPADRQRAGEAAGLISHVDLQAHARGLMAMTLIGADDDAARDELDRAYNLLAKGAAESTPSYGYHAAPVLAAWLLPLVEKLRPDQVEEYLWRAVSLRLPLAEQGEYEHIVLSTRAYLAMFLSRYDRDFARTLFGNLADELSWIDQAYLSIAAKGVYASLAMLDPARAVELYEQLPDDVPYNTRRSVRSALVEILSKQGEARWRAAAGYLRMPMPWQEIL